MVLEDLSPLERAQKLAEVWHWHYDERNRVVWQQAEELYALRQQLDEARAQIAALTGEKLADHPAAPSTGGQDG